MTNTAILGGGKVVGVLAECDHAVVTRRAVVDNAGMIEYSRSKAGRAMANRTVFSRGYMNYRFANGGRAVMTGSTVIHDTGVIEHGVNKTAGDVTDAAILGGR